ncbi:hypothetical protein [Erwinia pyrifoliae]|uniref:Uncharacterized protein n=1 Tax=Erwinia pyrifoliae TaxID=79967 RepID=A0ABY5XBT9_ERWPY|nr:hypothetical protein [Erwinia pyrifoliae]MCA8876497.1 hypothetical protein [Erwinia pyrifoliae]MCT2386614.1 hypothetical protein [Erwinia pyrifoliae]MCU8587789.1 hypothetical protein [Erwinia pyrifoliae]UWS31584.1 hypothetical protein NYP81_09190 [Erwinia pyrifoliae]UWS34610.1 hypothetical protein NYP84_05455 [Erwinia pyrifoliae]
MPANITFSELPPRTQSAPPPENRAKTGNLPDCDHSLLGGVSSVDNTPSRLSAPGFGIPGAIKNVDGSFSESLSDSSGSGRDYRADGIEGCGDNNIGDAARHPRGTGSGDGVDSYQVARDYVVSLLKSLTEQIKKEPVIVGGIILIFLKWICETIYEYGRQNGECPIDQYRAHGFSYPPHRLHGALREHVSVPQLAAPCTESSTIQTSSIRHYYTDTRVEDVNYSPRY